MSGRAQLPFGGRWCLDKGKGQGRQIFVERNARAICSNLCPFFASSCACAVAPRAGAIARFRFHSGELLPFGSTGSLSPVAGRVLGVLLAAASRVLLQVFRGLFSRAVPMSPVPSARASRPRASSWSVAPVSCPSRVVTSRRLPGLPSRNA